MCESGVENLCLDDIDGHWWGVAIELATLAYCFVGVGLVADAHLVVSLETLCVRWNVREDVAGASFMAFGSAAPEIIFSVISTLKSTEPFGGGGHDGGDAAGTGVGAIIGSGMIAFTAIPGCCGLFAKETLELKRRPLARDCGELRPPTPELCAPHYTAPARLAQARTRLRSEYSATS